MGGATVEGAKTVGSEAADKAEDAGDATVKGAKVAAGAAKSVGAEAADKAEDVGDATVKGAKKTGNWFSRGMKKIGRIFN